MNPKTETRENVNLRLDREDIEYLDQAPGRQHGRSEAARQAIKRLQRIEKLIVTGGMDLERVREVMKVFK
jgi:hypothetical protein